MRNKMVPYLFVVPAFLFVAVFIVYPLFYSILLSFTEYDYIYDKIPKFTGLGQYINLFSRDDRFWIAVKNTLIFGVLYFSIMMVFSLGIAIILDEVIVAKFFFQLSTYLPIIVPLSLAGVIFVWILDPTFGIFNFLLRQIGLTHLVTNWLGNYYTALYSLVVIKLWKFMGFTIIIFLAGLQSIPRTIYDAAKVDGANFLQEKLFITIPNLREYLLIASLYTLIDAIKIFELPYVATKGGPGNATLTLYFYTWRSAFGYYKMGKASAIAYVTAGLILLFSMIAVWTLSEKRKKIW